MIQTQILKFKHEDDTNIIVSLVSPLVDSEGDVRLQVVFYHNGQEWIGGSTFSGYLLGRGTDEDIAHELASMVDYYECRTDPGRKRPKGSITESVISAIRTRIENNSETVVEATKKFIADCKLLDGGADTEKQELRERVERAEKEAEKVDINAFILNSVVDAMTPQICERIREQVGSLVDAVPTRLEVKYADKEITTKSEVRHEKFQDVFNLVVAGFPVWLVGDAGTGKSILCEQIAEALDAEYRYSGAILDEFTGLKGFIDANGVHHGTQFTDALEIAESGTDVVFCMDECDGSTPEVLLVLNNLLSGGAVECMGKCYRLNEHLHIIACGNTAGRGGSTAYTRAILDSATLDRFFMVEVGYSKAIELVSAGGDEELAQFAHGVRDAAKRCGVELLVTYRAIKRLAKVCEVMDMELALSGALFRGVDASDIGAIFADMKEHEVCTTKWHRTMAAMSEK